MNIIDAIKSGKPFKRKEWSLWQARINGENLYYVKDILADDYELKEEKTKKSVTLYRYTIINEYKDIFQTEWMNLDFNTRYDKSILKLIKTETKVVEYEE
jgi:hypothetical protein